MTYLSRYSGNLPVYIWTQCQHGMSKVQAAVKPPCHLEHLTHCFQLGVTIMMNEDFPGGGLQCSPLGFWNEATLCFKKFYYLFTAVLGLHCCTWAFSSCESRGHSSLECLGFSLGSTSSRSTGSVVFAHRLCCSTACGIFLDQGSNLCPLAGRFLTTGLLLFLFKE